MKMKQRGIFGLSSISLVVSGALIVSVLGYVLIQKRSISKLEVERDTAIHQRDMASEARDKAIASALVNERTITQLQQEKADINTALNELQANQERARTTVIQRETVIQGQASVPSSRAIVVPVIASTIEAIQTDRAQRRPE